ncbi:MAG: DNA polymerase III subunit alpha [Bacilli bacterium]|jgi:DNA polymerase-3 subunit alpha|nr:DNA polymerase III subunit alpha [Bacilli bacterium]
MNFTNINVKSHYSLLQSTLKVNDIINHALSNDFMYVCLCDNNYFGGALEMYFKAKENNLIPIIGLSFNIEYNNNIIKINAYARNNVGFNNLSYLSSQLYLNDFVINYELLKEFLNNLIIVIDFYQEYFFSSFAYKNNDLNEKINLISTLFDEYYSYLSENNNNEYNQIVKNNIDNNKLIIASDASYLQANDLLLLKVLEAINKKTNLTFENLYNGSHYLINKDELINYDDKLINNTANFLSNFNLFDLKIDNGLPLYKETDELCNEYLEKLCFVGLKKRLNNNINDEYLNRLKYELKVIIEMGFANYFLIVYDYVLFAKNNDILVGPGRGSSAGSLVGYCLGITEVDPIKNKMLFERFLNPQRLNLPDIDVDFEDGKRYLIFDYLKDKYGYNNVAHICTFDTLKARNSLDDVGKVFDIKVHRIKMIKDLLPKQINISLKKVIQDNNELKLLLSTNKDLNTIYHIASKLEGINRNLSTHASGVIVNKNNLFNSIPVLKDEDNTLMSQYNMDYLEKINLYKMDVLGLATLGVLRSIKKYFKEDINFYKIDINDKKTLNLLSTGNTLGIFQFESEGVMRVLKRMRVDSINDLCVTTALFRPGPMKFIDEYIARKNEHKPFKYIVDEVKPILEETYGIIVYQEQVMQICQVLANFSLAKADIVRKGMAKKDKQVLEDIKNDFITSAINNNYSKEVATKVFDVILDFSGYGFNKTHAYSYALLAFYLAYFKANYPIIFFKAVLTNNINNNAKLKKYFYEMKILYNLEITNPDLNISTNEFEFKDNKFILPLISIDGIGANTAQLIIKERSNGMFNKYHLTIIRLIKIGISRSNIESFIYAGAIDFTGLNRTTMINNLDKMYHLSNLLNDKDLNQTRLDFKNNNTLDTIINNPNLVKYQDNENDIIDKEYQSLGLYLANHPLNKYMDIYHANLLKMISDKHQAIAIIDHVKEIKTKNNDLMAFVQVNDSIDFKTLVVFPRVYIKYKNYLKNKNIILITGHIDDKDDSNIIVNNIELINEKVGNI